MREYLDKITGILTRIEREEAVPMAQAAVRVADTLAADGLIFVFGCGHSHLPGLDAFYRAGGLANVSVMLDSDLMLHDGAAKSSRMEKMKGIGGEVFRRYAVQKRDCLIVISASGKNAVPVEVADAARAAGVPVIGISSSEYRPYGGMLHEHVDVCIDCKVPYGDACIAVGDSLMGGLSTAAACFILNSVLIDGAAAALDRGVKPPVYKSGNIEGGREHNVSLEGRFMGRIRHL